MMYRPTIRKALCAVAASLAFYRDRLGFVEIYRHPETGEPGFVSLMLDALKLGLVAEPTGERSRVDLWLYCDDVDGDWTRLRDAGAPGLQEPADMPWGERTASVADPDGNVVWLGAKL